MFSHFFPRNIRESIESLANRAVDAYVNSQTTETPNGRRNIVKQASKSDLEQFMEDYEKNKPSVYGCHIVVLHEKEEKRYRIMQSMLDKNGKPLYDDAGNVCGRIFYARSVGDFIQARMRNESVVEFTMSLGKLLSYDDLYDFATNYKRDFPEIAQSLVACVWNDEKSKFKVMQSMLDRSGTPLQDQNGAFLGRILYVNEIDEKISMRLKQRDCDEFVIALNE